MNKKEIMYLVIYKVSYLTILALSLLDSIIIYETFIKMISFFNGGKDSNMSI